VTAALLGVVFGACTAKPAMPPLSAAPAGADEAALLLLPLLLLLQPVSRAFGAAAMSFACRSRCSICWIVMLAYCSSIRTWKAATSKGLMLWRFNRLLVSIGVMTSFETQNNNNTLAEPPTVVQPEACNGNADELDPMISAQCIKHVAYNNLY
jgi:hypothetical protein